MLQEIGYYDGVFDAPANLKVSIEDRGFLFGEGIYEAILAYNGILWGVEDHFLRMERSLSLMEMDMPMSRAELLAVLEQAVSMVAGPTCFVYYQITRGAAPRKHSYLGLKGSKLMLIARTFTERADLMEKGYSSITVEDTRWQHCDIKTLNLIPNAMAATHAEQAGADTAIFCRNGLVMEGASYNVFIVKDNVVYTPPLSDLMLPGVTRKHILVLLPQLGIELREEYFSKEAMLAADEVFLTATTVHPAPVLKIDGQMIGSGQTGPIARRIHAAYEQMIEAHCGKHII